MIVATGFYFSVRTFFLSRSMTQINDELCSTESINYITQDVLSVILDAMFWNMYFLILALGVFIMELLWGKLFRNRTRKPKRKSKKIKPIVENTPLDQSF